MPARHSSLTSIKNRLMMEFQTINKSTEKWEDYPSLNFYLISPLSEVHLHHSWGVDWESLVWIDSDAEESRVGIDELVLVPNNGVPQDAGIPKISKIGHVNAGVKLGWIDLVNLVSFPYFLLENEI